MRNARPILCMCVQIYEWVFPPCEKRQLAPERQFPAAKKRQMASGEPAPAGLDSPLWPVI